MSVTRLSKQCWITRERFWRLHRLEWWKFWSEQNVLQSVVCALTFRVSLLSWLPDAESQRVKQSIIRPYNEDFIRTLRDSLWLPNQKAASFKWENKNEMKNQFSSINLDLSNSFKDFLYFHFCFIAKINPTSVTVYLSRESNVSISFSDKAWALLRINLLTFAIREKLKQLTAWKCYFWFWNRFCYRSPSSSNGSYQKSRKTSRANLLLWLADRMELASPSPWV